MRDVFRVLRDIAAGRWKIVLRLQRIVSRSCTTTKRYFSPLVGFLKCRTRRKFRKSKKQPYRRGKQQRKSKNVNFDTKISTRRS